MSVILMFKCLRTLLSDKTTQLINRRYSVPIQKNCFYWLKNFLWTFLLTIEIPVVQKCKFLIELQTPEEIDKFVENLGNYQDYSLDGEPDTKYVAVEICYSILCTINATCTYGKIFTPQQLSSTFVNTEDGSDQDQGSLLSLTKFTQLLDSLYGSLILVEISKLFCHSNVLEFSLVRQDYLVTNFLKCKEGIKDSIRFVTDCINPLITFYDHFVDTCLDGDIKNPLLDVFTMRGIFEPAHKVLNGVRTILLMLENENEIDELLGEILPLLGIMGLVDKTVYKTERGLAEKGYFLKKYLIKEYSTQISAIQDFIERKVHLPRSSLFVDIDTIPKTTLEKFSSGEKFDEKRHKFVSHIFENPAGFLGKLVISIESAICSINNPFIEKDYYHYMTETIENLQDEASRFLAELPEDGNWNLEMFRSRIARAIEVTTKEFKVIESESETTQMNERIRVLVDFKKVRLINAA